MTVGVACSLSLQKHGSLLCREVPFMVQVALVLTNLVRPLPGQVFIFEIPVLELPVAQSILPVCIKLLRLPVPHFLLELPRPTSFTEIYRQHYRVWNISQIEKHRA